MPHDFDPGSIDLDALRPHPLCAVMNTKSRLPGKTLTGKQRRGFAMTGEERNHLEQSIDRFGVRKRVVLDADDPLDGWNTLQSYRRAANKYEGRISKSANLLRSRRRSASC
jgi:hypothetical protein